MPELGDLGPDEPQAPGEFRALSEQPVSPG
jgi:hypothetical protein